MYTAKDLFILCISCTFLRLNEAYVAYTQLNMKTKIISMEAELVKDVIAKITSVENIRRSYGKTTAFIVGQTVFYIREQYKKMIKIHKTSSELVHFYPNSTMVDNLVEVNRIGMEIDHLFHMLEIYMKDEAAGKHIKPRDEEAEFLDISKHLRSNSKTKYQKKRSRKESLIQWQNHMERQKKLWQKVHNSGFKERNLKSKNMEQGFDSDI